jgi:hypothetical protein
MTKTKVRYAIQHKATKKFPYQDEGIECLIGENGEFPIQSYGERKYAQDVLDASDSFYDDDGTEYPSSEFEVVEI